METVQRNKAPENRKKIIFMWNYPNWGGAQVYFLAIIKRAKKDWDIKVVLPENSGAGFLKFLDEHEVEYEFIKNYIDFSPAKTPLEKIRRQWKRINSEFESYRHLQKSDLRNTILHIDTAPWQSWILIKMLSRRVKVFSTMHNALHVVSEWRAKIWSKRLNYVLGLKNFQLFVANEDAKNSLKPLVTPENWDKIVLTRAAINPGEIDNVLKTEFDRKELLEKFSIPNDKFIVLCVGQFIDRKGRWIFLEAARKMLASDNALHFVWLMPSLPTENDFEKIESYGLNESFQIVFSETVGKNRSDVLNFFRIADVFALPSLFEGLPIAILEAMALGIPTVSTNITAIPEAIIDRETGLLIAPNDSEALARAILELKENPDLRKKLARAGRLFVTGKFDETESSEIVIEHYERALKETFNV